MVSSHTELRIKDVITFDEIHELLINNGKKNFDNRKAEMRGKRYFPDKSKQTC